MKVNEVIVEGSKGKHHKGAAKASTGEWQFRDEGVDRDYNFNRVMIAAGMHDGKTTSPVKMDKASWVEKNSVARPYTEEEHRMMQGAFKTVGSHNHHSIPDHRSREQDDVHKVSPVGRTGPIKRKS
jgi:hypothetical protein